MRRPRWRASMLGFGIGLLLAGCVAETDTRAVTATGAGGKSADDLLIVDCLLPGQIRKLGSQMTYLSARRPIQTSAQDCEIRGGEYTAYDRANYSSALRVWLPMAQEGDPDAQNKVGEIYEKGLGGAPDYEMAAIWYKRAAEQGFSRAQINLAFLYEKGLGVPADPKQALQLYRDASDLPDAVVIDQAELDQSRLEMDRLRRDLDSTRSQLQQARNELQRRESELRRQQQELRRKLDENAGARLSPAERARIEEAEQALQRQRAELVRRQAQIQDLETESRDQRAQLLALRTEGESLREQLELARQQQARTREDLELYQSLAAQSADELEQARAELDALASGVGGDAARIATLEEQLATREKRLSQQKDETARLEEEAARLRRQLGESEAALEAERAALQGRLDAAGRQLAEYQVYRDESRGPEAGPGRAGRPGQISGLGRHAYCRFGAPTAGTAGPVERASERAKGRDRALGAGVRRPATAPAAGRCR